MKSVTIAGTTSIGIIHVIATEWGDPGRIERQLIGRSARQGDPGSFECCYSLDDEAARPHLPRWLAAGVGERGARHRGGVLGFRWGKLLTRWVRSAEESRRRRERRQLVALEEELEQMLAFSGRGE